MKKSKKIIAIVAILAVIVLAFIGGHAYAKYMTELRGEGTAEVATWSFKVNGNKTQVEDIALVSTHDDEKILDQKIAPGTNGSFKIIVDGTGSEVGINYTIALKDKEGNTKPQNLKFICDGNTYSSLEELTSIASGIINANDEDKIKTITVNWEWKYETGSTISEIAQNDIQDTEDAENASNYQFTVSVTGTQVNPQA